MADKSRNLPQDERKITVVQAEETHKMTIIFFQDDQKLLF
jgi:hypothetical protein